MVYLARGSEDQGVQDGAALSGEVLLAIEDSSELPGKAGYHMVRENECPRSGLFSL